MNLSQFAVFMARKREEIGAAVRSEAEHLDLQEILREFPSAILTDFRQGFKTGQAIESLLDQGHYKAVLRAKSLVLYGHGRMMVRTFEGPEVKAFYQEQAQKAKEIADDVPF